MRKILVALAGVAVVVFVTAASSATTATTAPAAATADVTSRAEVVIKHASFGCHVLSVNGERGAATQEVTLSQGGLVTVANIDTCRHTLVQASGPEPALIGDPETGKATDGSLPYATTVALSFASPGTYEFGTIEGPHGYTMQEKAGDAASARDHDLLLRVIVVPHGVLGGLPAAGHAAID